MTRYNTLQRRRRTRKDRQQASAAQKRFFRGVLLLIAVVLLIIFFFGDHGLYQLYLLKSERSAMQETITQLRAERQELETEKARLENDLEYIERLARERYRMAKKGEKVFKVLKKKKTPD